MQTGLQPCQDMRLLAPMLHDSHTYIIKYMYIYIQTRRRKSSRVFCRRAVRASYIQTYIHTSRAWWEQTCISQACFSNHRIPWASWALAQTQTDQHVLRLNTSRLKETFRF